MEPLFDAFGQQIRVGSVIAYASRGSCTAYLSRAIVREIAYAVDVTHYWNGAGWIEQRSTHPYLKVAVVGKTTVYPGVDDEFAAYDKPVLRKTQVQMLDRVTVVSITEEQFMQQLDREALEAYATATQRYANYKRQHASVHIIPSLVG